MIGVDIILIYYERQKPGNILKLFSVITAVVFGILTIYIDSIYLTGVAISIIFSFVLQITRFDITVYQDRIEYKCIPFHRASIEIRFDEVEYIEVRRIKNGLFYAGFKIKHTLKSSLYMFGGYDVIKIYRYNKPDIILTTQKIEKVRQALIRYDIKKLKKQ